jgi:hypothetical protein
MDIQMRRRRILIYGNRSCRRMSVSSTLHQPRCIICEDSPYPVFAIATALRLPDNTFRTRLQYKVHRYSRADLLRILHLTARQLAGWEKAELVSVAETYTFFDLLQVKKVRDLCARKVRPAVIRQSLEAMQKQAAGMENPLLEAGAISTGHRVAFRHQGRVL